jgi:hypothetical protein
MKLSLIRISTLLLFFLFAVVSPAGTTLTFDTLGSGAIPNGYGGLDWSTYFYTLDADTYGFPSGYQNGTVSHPMVAYNAYALDVYFSSITPFTFDSAYLTAAWNNGLNIEVQGLNGATVVYDETVVVNATGPTLFNFDYSNVTEVYFSSFGGTSAGYAGGGTHFVMDNLTINATVPEPAAFLLVGAGLMGLVALRRRA